MKNKKIKKEMSQQEQAKQSFLSLMLTVVIPAVLLMKLGTYTDFSALQILFVALSFPAAYGFYELKTVNSVSFLAIFGFVSVLLTGGVAALQLPPRMIAVKESLIPFIIGVIIFVSAKRGKPALTFMLKSFFNFEKIEAAFIEKKQDKQWGQILLNATYILCASFMVSSVLNYVLASMIVRSPAGTDAFNHELGVLTALSYPVIAVPSMIVMVCSVWYVVRKVKAVTAMTFTDMVREELT